MNLELFQKILPASEVKGDIIPLSRSHAKHWHGIQPEKVPESTSVNFAEVLNQALLKVNDQQVHAEGLVQKMISDPRSVKLHTVLIASEKARMSLNFTKTIADMAVRTYRELSNLR